jgi:uncharacterized protein YgiM (DUF1202 family)
MELFLILFIIVVIGGGAGLVGYSATENHATAKRALKIGKANKAIESRSFESEQAKPFEQIMAEALEAQRAEQKLLSDNWDNEFLELLPDTDPQKNAYNLKKAGIEVLEAEDLYPPNIPYTGEQLAYSERVITKTTGYVRNSPTDTSDFIATFQQGATIRVYGYTRGRMVGKTDIWYQIKTKSFDGWIWAGSLNSSEIRGLSRLDLVRQRLSPIEQQAINNAYKITGTRWRS